MSLSDTATTLLSAWNEPDADARAAIVAETASERVYYADPHLPTPTTSADGLLSFLATFRERVPDAELVVDGEPDVHHGHARVRFTLLRSRVIGFLNSAPLVS